MASHVHRPPSLLALLLLALAPSLLAQEPAGPLTVGGAARAAAKNAAAVAVARERGAQADARVRQRRADLLPAVSAAISEGERTLNSAGFGLTLANPATGQPFLDPRGQVLGPVRSYDLRATVRSALADPAALARLTASKSAAGVADAETRAAEQQAATVAALAAVTALRAQAHVQARLADSSLAAQQLGIARDQLAAGVGIRLDVTRAESQVAQVRSQLLAARTAFMRARIDLARSLGLPATSVVTLADGLETPDFAVGEPDATTARARRPDVSVVTHQIDAAGQQVRAVQAERLPAVSAFVDDGAIGTSTNRLLNTWSWGVQVGVPVFDGFRREGRIAEQRAAARELELRKKDLEEQVNAEVATAVLELAAAREQVNAALGRQRLAELETAQAQDRFSSGVSGNADLIAASLNLNAARTFVVDALASHLAARVMLARALGTVTEIP